jgi:AcrR family transcriptional regulator
MGKGARTREAILRSAADVASVEGLLGLSIGGLAARLGLSKSGLFAHFRSKEALQLETIEAARLLYVDEVVRPALEAPRGVRRLLAMCDRALLYIGRRVFPGGCFFVAAQAELHARPGVLRDRIAEYQRWWLDSLEREVRRAQESGEVREDVDPAQLAFELEALLFLASSTLNLDADDDGLARARVGTLSRISAALAAGAPPLAAGWPLRRAGGPGA